MSKTCSLCNKTTDAEGDCLLYYGEWMSKSDVTVHYYCLLLSTHLPQTGEDFGGILGFYLRDIRKEAKLAKSRFCKYCRDSNATIRCHKCKRYFHLICGLKNMMLSYFIDDFRSYCGKCAPQDYQRKELLKKPPDGSLYLCNICTLPMGECIGFKWIYSKCCNNGYVHDKCMRIYALQAGYYLKCIWCKDTRFRDDVKYVGIFVPDRDANWELEKGAYRDLYRKQVRCDMDNCKCPKGKEYVSAKWSISKCVFCGSFGVHNPQCIPGTKEKVDEFKCEICLATERTLSQTLLDQTVNNTGDESRDINTTLHVRKKLETAASLKDLSGNLVEFSDDSLTSLDTEIHMSLKQKTMIESFSKQCRMTPAETNVDAVRNQYIPSLTQGDSSCGAPNTSNVSSLTATSQPEDPQASIVRQTQCNDMLEKSEGKVIASLSGNSSPKPFHINNDEADAINPRPNGGHSTDSDDSPPDPRIIQLYRQRLLANESRLTATSQTQYPQASRVSQTQCNDMLEKSDGKVIASSPGNTSPEPFHINKDEVVAINRHPNEGDADESPPDPRIIKLYRQRLLDLFNPSCDAPNGSPLPATSQTKDLQASIVRQTPCNDILEKSKGKVIASLSGSSSPEPFHINNDEADAIKTRLNEGDLDDSPPDPRIIKLYTQRLLDLFDP